MNTECNYLRVFLHTANAIKEAQGGTVPAEIPDSVLHVHIDEITMSLTKSSHIPAQTGGCLLCQTEQLYTLI